MIPHRRMKLKQQGRGGDMIFLKNVVYRHNDVDVHINSNPPRIEKIKYIIYEILKSKCEKNSFNTLTQMH